jgi:4-amino-4-deoxy-L-arabinose transferase-like glycosyltransferase
MTLMASPNPVQEDETRVETPTQAGRRLPPLLLFERMRRAGRTLANNERAWRYVGGGVVVALLTTVAVLLYYLNKPGLELDPDTPTYVTVAQYYATKGWGIDVVRLPGYPILMWLVFKFAGANNLGAMQITQAALFVVATVELYVLLCLIQQRIAIAVVVALLVGTNLIMLSYVKAILSEGLELFLVVNLALAIIWYLQRPGWLRLWVIAGIALALFMTRPEWMYFPALLFPFLFLVACWQGKWRQVLPHALAALILLYVVLGAYIHSNWETNQCNCVTYVQNINLLGKIMQYHMQNEAPPQYAAMARLVNRFVSRGDVDPWDVKRSNYAPAMLNGYELMGTYSQAIILHHPVEYVLKSVPVGVSSLATTAPFKPIHTHGPNATLLDKLQGFSMLILSSMILFPIVALFWWVWLLRRRKAASLLVLGMAALSLMGLYGFAVTTLGGYVYYPRLHTPFDPLMIAVVWGSLLLGGIWLWARVAQLRRC